MEHLDILIKDKINKENKEYKKIKELHDLKIEAYKNLELDNYRDREELISKLYILFNDIKKVVEYMNKNGFRIESAVGRGRVIKIRIEHIKDILRNLKNEDKNKYKRLARIQYKANGGLI